MITYCIVIGIFSDSTIAGTADTCYHEQMMAETVMNTWKDSFSLDGKPAKWTYDMGVILKGFEGSG